jgi:hypothetical protein
MPFDLAPFRLDATEARLGVRLPAAYRASMIRANGGTVEVAGDTWWLHPILDDSDTRRLKRTMNDLVHETTEARAWPGFPRDAVALANNGSGDYLVLLPSGDEVVRAADAVHRWDHETGELARVAGAFDELTWSRG